MTIDFGLALLDPPLPPNGDYNKWLADFETTLPLLQNDFRSLWAFDAIPEGANTPYYDAWTVMSFMAAHFPAYEIGSLVMAHGFRNPAHLALMAAMLQTLSKGRFTMGIGAGHGEKRYTSYNYEYPRDGIRIEQLEDVLNIFKKLWMEPGPVNYEGKHYKVTDAWCWPKPDPMIPILVGGPGKKTMRLAAQYADMWNTYGANIEVFTGLLDILKQQCDDLGRDIATLRLSALCQMFIAKTQEAAEKAAEKAGVGDALIGTPERIAEQMAKFTAVGVDYFMLYIHGLHEPDTVGLITEELMPIVKAM